MADLASVDMRQAGLKLPRILVIPHVAIQGGAGIYNLAAFTALARHAEITLIGEYAAPYAAGDCKIADLDLPARPILPTYAGASLKSLLYYSCLAPLRFIRLYFWALRNRATLSKYDALVATSSIDLASIIAIGMALRDMRLTGIIQENVYLSGIRGALNRRLLSRIDEVVSISGSWSKRAAACNIYTTLALNSFCQPAKPATANDDMARKDILYMGGGERIKGFEQFLSITKGLAKEGPIHASLLGPLNADQELRVKALQEWLARNGSSLDAPGYVEDTIPYLDDARLLLLPILEPHFCRPAIEAGLRGRTFVVSALTDLDDFANPGSNCAAVRAGDIEGWCETCRELLLDDVSRRRLAKSNQALATSAFSQDSFALAYDQIAARCR